MNELGASFYNRSPDFACPDSSAYPPISFKNNYVKAGVFDTGSTSYTRHSSPYNNYVGP